MPSLAPTVWERTKRGSKAGLDKLWSVADKLNRPYAYPSKIGSEAFWPATLDRESIKCAQVLRSFCRDGFLYDDYEEDLADRRQDDDSSHTGSTGRQPQRALMKIPPDVIRNAQGLAIFTVMRAGLWLSGPGGSGVLIARTANGTWSPPSSIMIHAAGLYFPSTIDIYDCVLVLNTQQAVDAFTKMHFTLGEEMDATAGQMSNAEGTPGVVLQKQQAPMFTYLRSKGFYADVSIDGAVIEQRADENDRFYSASLPARDIVAGRAPRPMPSDVFSLGVLDAMLRVAEGGHLEADEVRLLPSEPTPSDYDVYAGPVEPQPSGHSRKPSLSSIKRMVDGGTNTSEPSPPDSATSSVFGVPLPQDPDPFGVRALEQQGLAIREAGTHRRASSEQFNFHPLPSSPIYPTFNRLSIDSRSGNMYGHGHRPPSSSNGSISRRSSWRTTVFGFGSGRERSGSVSNSDKGANGGGLAARNAAVALSSPMTPIAKGGMVESSTQTDMDDNSQPMSSPTLHLQPPHLPPRPPTTISEVPEIEAYSENYQTGNFSDQGNEIDSTSAFTLTVQSISPHNTTTDKEWTEESASKSDREGLQIDLGDDVKVPSTRPLIDNEVSPRTSPMDPKGPILSLLPPLSLADTIINLDSPVKTESKDELAPAATKADEQKVEDAAVRISVDEPAATTAPTTDAAYSPSPSSRYDSRPPSSAATSPPLSHDAFASVDSAHSMHRSHVDDVADDADEEDDDDDDDDDTFVDFDDIQTVEYGSATAATATPITPITPTTITATVIKPTGATAVTPVSISRPRVVNVPKRIAPALPPRNPNRAADRARERKGSVSSAITIDKSPPTPVSTPGSSPESPQLASADDVAAASPGMTTTFGDSLGSDIKRQEIELPPRDESAPLTPMRSPRRIVRPVVLERKSSANVSTLSTNSQGGHDADAEGDADNLTHFTDSVVVMPSKVPPTPISTTRSVGDADDEEAEEARRGRARERDRSVSRGRVGRMETGRAVVVPVGVSRAHAAHHAHGDRSASPAVVRVV